MSDEIYGQMTYDGLAHVSLLTYPEIRDRLILLDGWSKTYAMTGWRMGCSVWPKPLYDNVRKLAVNAWSCVNAPRNMPASPRSTGPQDAVEKMVAEFDRRRQDRGRGVEPTARHLLRDAEGRLLRLPEHHAHRLEGEGARLTLLEEAGVATIGGPDFGILGEGYLRLSYANSAENISRRSGASASSWRRARRRRFAPHSRSQTQPSVRRLRKLAFVAASGTHGQTHLLVPV